VENRLRHLVASGAAASRVIAPVPWFPFASPVFGEYAAFARAPRREQRHGFDIDHPRYVVLPKIGQNITPWTLYRGSRGAFRALLATGYRPDVIDAHFFYPDGVAAALLGREFGLPVVITARGTDLNLMLQYALPRRMIAWAAGRAAAMVTVCQALKDELTGTGVADERVTVLRNGVDLQAFRPVDGSAIRSRHLKGNERLLLSVGLLIPRKGHDLIVRALAQLPDCRLLIAGEGPERGRLEALAAELGVADRVTLLGRVPHGELAAYYSAADALVLASSREGWANVLLEAMACGTPVAASDVWGTPEVVATPAAGRLLPSRTADGIVQALTDLFADPPDRAATRAYAEGFSWDATTEGQRVLFERIVGERKLAA
jgi:glycosyltransferase involved in cell wall biosynthesis